MSEGIDRNAPVIPTGVEFVSRHVIVRAPDVVFVKGIVEAHDGLAQVYAERGGELMLSAPRDRAQELDDLVHGLCFDRLCVVSEMAPNVASD